MASFRQPPPDAKRLEEMSTRSPLQPPAKTPPTAAVDGLPPHFVDSLRVLFDILDENGRGLVRLADIQRRWSGAGVQHLPRGVLDSLAKVTPSSGMLSFERFVSGLKIALLRSGPTETGRPPDVDRLWKQKVAGNPPPPLRRGGTSQPEMKGSANLQNGRGERSLRAWDSETQARTPKGDGSQDQQAPARRERRGDPRRHTVTNGIDYGLLKRMKQLESEKDLLVQGLETVERARQWYLKQMAALHDRQSSLGRPQLSKMADAVGSPEAQQQRLDYQRSRVNEANRQLQLLIDSSNFPASHINLAVVAPGNGPGGKVGSGVKSGLELTISALRDQNRQLTVEVSQKSQRLTQLEKEKAALIRELFQARARGHKDLNGTFM